MSSGVAINLMGGLTKTHTHSLASVPGSLLVEFGNEVKDHEFCLPIIISLFFCFDRSGVKKREVI